MSPALRARPSSIRARIPALALAGLLLAAVVAPAQTGADEAFGGLTLHHTAPRAGAPLTLVVQGGVPGEPVLLELFEPTLGPPSLLAYVYDEPLRRGLGESTHLVPSEDALVTRWFADERGLVVLKVDLDDPADADRPIFLRARTDTALSERLHLHVHPPQLVIEAPGALQRIDLRDGRRLDPAIHGRGGLAGLALSADGVEGWLLREGGRLEVRNAARWNSLLRAPRESGGDTSGLASSLEGGPAFLLARPAGAPLPAGGRLTLLDETRASLGLGPMGQDVGGRRWAVTDDGLTAFLAEDDLLVREVDLLGHAVRGAFVAGMVGDEAITDMLVQDRTLVVATRRLPGRPGGTLTFLDLDTGTLSLADLDVTPRRLVALAGADAGGGVDLLVVAGDERAVQRVTAGVPRPPTLAGPLDESGAAPVWVDAAAVPGGALLLRADPRADDRADERADDRGGRALWSLDADGRLRELASPVPAVDRIVTAGGDVALLLGDPTGAVHRVDLGTGTLARVEGVAARPRASFVVLD